MIIAYTHDEFKSAKSRDKLKLTCEFCNLNFYAAKKEITWAIKCEYRKLLRFCNKQCKNKYVTRKIESNCKQCNSLVYRKPSEIDKSKSGYVFCSVSCSVTYGNAHKTHGTSRSKLEFWIENKLKLTFPTLDILYNDNKKINAELDIYIPSLALAFELNGIFHYEPIFGADKLSKTQTNDKRKFQACLENNIELCIIDTSKQRYFKESTSLPILDVILYVINKKSVSRSVDLHSG